jgi:hypothetical protein
MPTCPGPARLSASCRHGAATRGLGADDRAQCAHPIRPWHHERLFGRLAEQIGGSRAEHFYHQWRHARTTLGRIVDRAQLYTQDEANAAAAQALESGAAGPIPPGRRQRSGTVVIFPTAPALSASTRRTASRSEIIFHGMTSSPRCRTTALEPRHRCPAGSEDVTSVLE